MSKQQQDKPSRKRGRSAAASEGDSKKTGSKARKTTDTKLNVEQVTGAVCGLSTAKIFQTILTHPLASDKTRAIWLKIVVNRIVPDPAVAEQAAAVLSVVANAPLRLEDLFGWAWVDLLGILTALQTYKHSHDTDAAVVQAIETLVCEILGFESESRAFLRRLTVVPFKPVSDEPSKADSE